MCFFNFKKYKEGYDREGYDREGYGKIIVRNPRYPRYSSERYCWMYLDRDVNEEAVWDIITEDNKRDYLCYLNTYGMRLPVELVNKYTSV